MDCLLGTYFAGWYFATGVHARPIHQWHGYLAPVASTAAPHLIDFESVAFGFAEAIVAVVDFAFAVFVVVEGSVLGSSDFDCYCYFRCCHFDCLALDHAGTASCQQKCPSRSPQILDVCRLRSRTDAGCHLSLWVSKFSQEDQPNWQNHTHLVSHIDVKRENLKHLPVEIAHTTGLRLLGPTNCRSE